MSNSFDICIHFSEYLHTLHAHSVLHTRERQKLWGRVFPQPLNFFNRRVTFVHNFRFPATFITDKFWSDLRLRRLHGGDVFSILFHRLIDRAILLVTLFHRSIDQAIRLFGDTFCTTPASKNQFRNIQTRNCATCASGSGSVGVPSALLPYPPPPLLKKSVKKNPDFLKLPSPPPFIDWESIGKKYPLKVSCKTLLSLTRGSSGGPLYCRVNNLELSLWPSRSLSRALRAGAWTPARSAPCTKGLPIRINHNCTAS